MKILSLSGENLASLSAPFCIDFSQGVLADAGLFAICGNTGSGKSTLLDAICLSLFDAMPRFSNNRRGPAIGHAQSEANERLKSNDVRHIMTRGAGSCFSQVTFELDNGVSYQATWTLKRARNSANGRFQAQEMELLEIKSGQVLAVKKTEVLALIEGLIGLNYEQFRRSVLLAQGDFAAFLKAPAKERSDLLERITGTELYSTISKLAYTTAKESEQQLKLLQSKLGEVNLLPESAQQELVKQIGVINEALANVSEQQMQLQWLEQTLEQRQQSQSQLDEGTAELTTIETRCAEQETTNQLLQQIELAQDAKLTQVQLDQNQRQQQGVVSQQQSLAAELEQQHRELVDTQAQVTQLDNLKVQSQQDYQQQLPQIELAITRHNDITHLAQKIAQDSQQIDLIESQRNQVQLKLTNNAQQLKRDQQTLSQLAQYLSQHQTIAPLVNQLASIEQDISDYQQLSESCDQYQQKITQAKQKLVAAQQQLSQDKQMSITQQQQVTVLQQQLQQYAKAFEGANLAQIEQRQTQLQQQLTDDIAQLQLVIQGLEYQSMIGNKEHKLQDIATHLEQLRSQYQQVKQTLHLHQPALDEAQKSLNQARNVMSLHDHRQLLIDGEACALCGSLDHPFTKSKDLGDVLVEQLNQRHQQLLQEGNDLSKQLVKLDVIGQEQAALQKTLSNEIEMLKQSVNNLGCGDISVAQQGKLEADIASVKQQIEQTKAQYQQTVGEVEQARDVEQQLTALIHQVELTDQAMVNANNTIASIGSEQLLDQQYLTQYSGQLTIRIDKLNQCYPQANWSLLLKDAQQLIGFQHQLAQDVEQFVEKSNYHQQLETELREIEQSKVMLAEQEHQLSLQMSPLAQQLTKDQQTMVQWRDEIEQLTHGVEPAAHKQALEQKMDQLTQALQNAQHALNASSNQFSVTQSKAVSCQAQQTELAEQLELLNIEWLGWQKKLAVDDRKLTELLTYQSSWIVDTKQAYAALQQSLHQHQAVIDQLRRQITQINLKLEQQQPLLLKLLPTLAPQPGASSLAQRVMLGESLSASLTGLTQEQFTYRSQLEHHNQAMVRFGQLQQEIDQQMSATTLWCDMKELIGSADGAKFRTFAQSLTLEQMLVSANHHLLELAPRYQLQAVPSSELDLQIIDLDMGDEIRSVDSLSGGECFLVSLALALGLGSLTSLQTSINTLFIDEGFGTLDPDTLELALSCLDSLQATGRQIGIISHVQGLVERVGTRIQISAHGSGQSTIEILAR